MRVAVVATLVASSLFACQKTKRPDLEPAPSGVRFRYDEATLRLSTGYLENGWVVTRRADGSAEHVGEGLLWTGLWLYAAPCEVGAGSAAMLRQTITRNGGALVRYEPLGEYAGGREITLDGAIGLYRGISATLRRCPGEGEAWAEPLALHIDYLISHNDQFNEASPAYLSEEFGYVLQAVASHLSLARPPLDSELRSLEVLVAGWAAAVNATHAAAYRVHLGLVALQTVEAMGFEVDWTAFCAATRGVGIPTVDYQCGRGDLRAWIDEFQYNKYEYRHQRADWESEDGNGLATPGLDLLVAMRDAYQL